MVSGGTVLGKVGYLSGPTDARKVHDALHSGFHTDLFGTSYLQHWYKVLAEKGLGGVVVTSNAGEGYDDSRGAFTIYNRPKPTSSGLAYHFDMIRWTRDRLAELEAAGCDLVVMTDAQHYWFVSAPFRKRGMRFINSYHCAVRPLAHNSFSPHEIFIRLTNRFHLSHGDPTMAVSPFIFRQLDAIAGSDKREKFIIRPNYDRALFADCKAKPPRASGEPVNILFAGRVEANKGVFDMLEACEKLNRRDGPRFHFHMHGEGEALEALKVAAASSPEKENFSIYGFTAGSELARHYEAADIVVVPTRSTFEEGMAKSVIEGTLALRPVVTSVACPVLETLTDACVEAEVDNVDSYVDAIWSLAHDSDLVDDKVAAARELRELYFEPPDTYGAQLKRAMELV